MENIPCSSYHYVLLGDPGYAGPQGLKGEIGQKGGFVVLKMISLLR